MTDSTRKSASGGQEAKTRKHWRDRVAATGYGLGAKMLMTGPELSATIAFSNWDHYVYGLCDPHGYPFYVGKGVRDRALAHAIDAEAGCDSEKAEAIRSLGYNLRYTIYLQCQDDTPKSQMLTWLGSWAQQTDAARNSIEKQLEAIKNGG